MLDIDHVDLNDGSMEITITGPIEAFIQRQVAQGYKNADEVARQAFLRWMSEESDTPAHIQTRLDEAAAGRFIPGDRSNIQRIIAAA
jgi:Arc/MetJ-type ribon-helix-helix transcriptional regulator